MDKSERPIPPAFKPYNNISYSEIPVQNMSKISTVQIILRQFRDKDGNLDVEKITTVFQQISRLYGQISPLITKFAKWRRQEKGAANNDYS